MSPQAVARQTLKGMRKERYLIFPSLESSLYFKAGNLLGAGIYPIIDWLVRLADQKEKRSQTAANTTPVS